MIFKLYIEYEILGHLEYNGLFSFLRSMYTILLQMPSFFLKSLLYIKINITLINL